MPQAIHESSAFNSRNVKLQFIACSLVCVGGGLRLFGFLEFAYYPLGEALELFYSESLEELEGQGPYRAREGYDNEVSDRSCNVFVTEEGYEGLAESGLDSKDDGDAEGELYHLRIPSALSVKLDNKSVEGINEGESE